MSEQLPFSGLPRVPTWPLHFGGETIQVTEDQGARLVLAGLASFTARSLYHGAHFRGHISIDAIRRFLRGTEP